MIGPIKNPTSAKDKKVSDDFYDRVNYYEARNIFSSNEPVNPNNRLYTDHVSNTHSVWNTIQKTGERYLFDQFSNVEKETSGVSEELAKNIYNNLNKYTASGSGTACRLCGYVGHLAYQCRNNIVLKNKKKKEEKVKEIKTKEEKKEEKEEGEIKNKEHKHKHHHKHSHHRHRSRSRHHDEDRKHSHSKTKSNY